MFVKFIRSVSHLVPIVNWMSFILYFLSGCCTHRDTIDFYGHDFSGELKG